MSGEPRVFKVSRNSEDSIEEKEVDFKDNDIKETSNIQEWVAANPSILEEGLLVVAKEFRGFDVRERPDLIAVDSQGGLVVIELKRDDSGADVHWQAIKYASYLRKASADDITSMLSDYLEGESDNPEQLLLEHLQVDDDELPLKLNKYQRIILASHRFRPEVTSAALWLNEISNRTLITCISLTPYDFDDKNLHVVSSTIVPLPGEADISVGIGNRESPASSEKTSELRKRNRHDDITAYLEDIAERVIDEIDDEYKSIKTSRHAGGNEEYRYYHYWHREGWWSNWGTAFRIELYTEESYPDQINGRWAVWVGFVGGEEEGFELHNLKIHEDQKMIDSNLWIEFENRKLDDELRDLITDVLVKLINACTPIINDFHELR